ncbi:MAG: ankyrin repeat domain-containing protein [Candidatus Anstonellaceae archaeon]
MEIKNSQNKKENNIQNENRQKQFDKFKLSPEEIEKILKADKPYLAASRNDFESLKILIENGKDVNQQDIFGYTALMMASIKNNLEIAKYLVEHKADLNIINCWGDSAIVLAAEFNSIDVGKYLLEKGADPTIKNFFGFDALRHTIENRNFEFFELIKKYLENYEKNK